MLLDLHTGEMTEPTSHSTNIYLSTSQSISPDTSPSAVPLTLLVAGISTPLLILLLALAVLIITIIAIAWIKRQKSTKNVHNQVIEQQNGPYSTLTRSEYTDVTLNDPMDALYAVVDMDKHEQEEEGKMMQEEKIAENPPNQEEKKRGVALEDLYAVVNKQQKKIQNEDTPPAQSNMDDKVYYNTALAMRSGHDDVHDEKAAPQVPPHTVESYTQPL